MTDTSQTGEGRSHAPVSLRLSRVAALMKSDPLAAARGASAILDEIPGQPQALFILVAAMRLMKKDAEARELLEWLVREHPDLASIRYELGVLLDRLSSRSAAIRQLSRVLELEPNHAHALLAVGDQLSLNGDGSGAGGAYARYVKLGLRELELVAELTSLGVDELIKAERTLLTSLGINPQDAMTRWILAKVYMRLCRFREAQAQLERALELAPDFRMAREDYATALGAGMRYREANGQFDLLMEDDPARRVHFRYHKAANLAMLGDYQTAFGIFDDLRRSEIADPAFWLNYGHALRTVAGRVDEAISAYRQCVEINPADGHAWWALADLKTYRFSPSEIGAMEAQSARDDLPDTLRMPLQFSLGRALETRKDYEQSFKHYSRGNALYRREVSYDPAHLTRATKESKEFFTTEFFRKRTGYGCATPDPIFIVGMARSGSTLLEQMLASHSSIEGTRELPDLIDVVAELRMRNPGVRYPQLLEDLEGAEFSMLGERYLELAARQRMTGRPFFTDKAGLNYAHVGFLALVLPNAKIIDARRHPLGCCFSCYKQIFPFGSLAASYDLREMALLYRDYVEVMAHFDRLMPGRVLRVHYEDVVNNPEEQVRRMLAYCGLEFEEHCLRYYESDRAVRTVSSEQVRRPIDMRAGQQWQNYEPWLGPAKEALGEVLTLYPRVPAFNEPAGG